MTSGNDTYGKAPILNPGEYDWWVRDIEAYICSGDSQVWGIVKRGPLPIKDTKNPNKEKNEAEYTDEDHRINEKNLRAKRILLSALSPADKRKIMKYDTAHEIWKALARLYGGNTDIKRNRILAASNEYENTIQGNAESLEEFHSRFQTCLGQLEFLGEVIPEWKVTHHFLQSLNSKWDSVSMALQAQSNIKEISLEDLVANLQSQSAIVERKLARRQPDRSKAIALKVETTFDLAQTNEVYHGDDEEIALISRAFNMHTLRQRQILKGKQKVGEGSNFKNVRQTAGGKADQVCYHCQKKGHFAKDCFKKKSGLPPAQKDKQAMLVAWGETDEDSDNPEEGCLMAGSSSPSKVTNSKQQTFSPDVYIKDIDRLILEIEKLNIELGEKEDYIEGLSDNHDLWQGKAMRLEEEKANHRCRKCVTCKGRQEEIEVLNAELEKLRSSNDTLILDLEHFEENETESKELVRKLNGEIAKLKTDLEEISATLEKSKQDDEVKKDQWKKEMEAELLDKERKDFKARFRPGIGYSAEGAQMAKSPEVKCNGSCQKLKGKVGEQESPPIKGREYPTEQSIPFDAKKAYHIWNKQKNSKAPSKVNFQKRLKDKWVPPGRSKYVGLKCHRICWHCGHMGHYQSECSVLDKLRKKVCRKYAAPITQFRPRSTLHRREVTSAQWKPRTTPKIKIDLNDSNLSLHSNVDTSIRYDVLPRKPKLVWVRKN